MRVEFSQIPENQIRSLGYVLARGFPLFFPLIGALNMSLEAYRCSQHSGGLTMDLQSGSATAPCLSDKEWRHRPKLMFILLRI